MSTRPNIPQRRVDDLMFINRHTCCICHTPRRHVQVHHIDGNSSNNSIENFAVLCLDCHSIVTGDEGLGRRYTPGEVSNYKRNWEARWGALDESVKGGGEDDEKEPIESHYEDSILDADSHFITRYDLEEDHEVYIWMASDRPTDLAIMRHKDYKRWLKIGKITSYEELYEKQLELETCFTVPEDGRYSVVVINDSSDDVEVQLDISVWSGLVEGASAR